MLERTKGNDDVDGNSVIDKSHIQNSKFKIQNSVIDKSYIQKQNRSMPVCSIAPSPWFEASKDR